MILRDYRCTECGWEFESLEDRDTTSIPCPDCSGQAETFISGVKLGTVWGYAATTGENQTPPPGAMDTRSLADGESYSKWRNKRRAERRDQRRRENGIAPKPFSIGKG